MRLQIENIAKIEKADIEINGITVIAGENNTGKSTIGKILYCVFDTFYNISNKVSNQRRSNVENIIERLGYFDENTSDFIYIYDPWDDEIFEVYKKISEITTVDKEKAIKKYKEILNEDDTNYFDNIDDIVNKVYNAMCLEEDDIRKTIILRIFNEEFASDFFSKATNSEKISNVQLDIKNQTISVEFENDNNLIKVKKINRYIPLLTSVTYIDDPFVLDYLGTKNYGWRKIGVNRHTNNLFSKLRSSSKTDDIDQTIINEKNHSIKEKLNDIIHGDFIVNDSDTSFIEDGFSLPHKILNLSTGIKSLGILLRLLENGHIKDNGTIILDEPEIHLHPKWQLKFAEVLIMMQKELNLHILINTHSPYFIRALETYSAKNDIADKCKYYLASLNENNKSQFEDVTLSLGKVYDLLSEPFQLLADIEEEINGRD